MQIFTHGYHTSLSEKPTGLTDVATLLLLRVPPQDWPAGSGGDFFLSSSED